MCSASRCPDPTIPSDPYCLLRSELQRTLLKLLNLANLPTRLHNSADCVLVLAEQQVADLMRHHTSENDREVRFAVACGVDQQLC